MAMDKASMATKIINKLAALNPEITASPVYELYWREVSAGIIEEITQNMDVTTVVSIPNAQAGTSTLPGTGQDTLIS